MQAYPIRLTKDVNGTFLVTSPDFPGLTTFGLNKADARRRAVDAIEEAIAARRADAENIPNPPGG